MNNRQRVLTAIAHQEPDVVPYDIASPSHDLPADAKAENIAAMIEVLQDQ
ncbi:MAG: hypothetical protein ISS70_06705 [Phycisphaerae bacterium]|nr:hypothetical protein [Phycisphaerae bacterium]